MSYCFVIQPFDRGAFDKRFYDVFAPAIKKAGLDPYRVDLDPSVSIPVRAIEGKIRDADLCLADISTDNPNVWFELGFALAAGKEVVLVCAEGARRDFPFDVRDRNILSYRTDSPRDFKELRAGITARVQALLKKVSRVIRGPLTPEFLKVIKRHKDDSIARYTGIGWGSAISLQDCPNWPEGWALDTVKLRLSSEPFQIPPELRAPYERFCAQFHEKYRLWDDGEKFFLEANPHAFSDAPTLILNLRRTRYSEVMFYREKVAHDTDDLRSRIDELFCGTLRTEFPHSFCMHGIVETADAKLFLMRRSGKTIYARHHWSLSLEEQLSSEDLVAPDQFSASKWAARMLKEELGLGPDSYKKEDLRLLSILLESNILNLACCVHAKLLITSEDLRDRLSLPIKDREFDDWDFLDIERRSLLRQLLSPSRRYHPTSQYRLLLTYLSRFGIPSDSELAEL
jgi:hypothetical protein